MSAVSGPQASSKVKKCTLYLCGNKQFYLTSEKEAELCNHAKYFRTGSSRLFVTQPTWFKSEKLARAQANLMGFRVVRRKGL